MTSKVKSKAIKQSTIDENFLTGPGEDIVVKTMQQMATIDGFISLFGKYKGDSQKDRWADYQRHDWSTRQLPAINIFEGKPEDKESDNAYLNGTITFQIIWPPSARRADSRQYEAAFKGAMENFFASDYVTSMLDEIYFNERPQKVYGLNEYGRKIIWEPNTEGLIQDEAVPVTILHANYRIDLRAWYRALEYQGRTKGEPFKQFLADLKVIGGTYDGIDENNELQTQIDEEIPVNQ